MSRTLDIIEAKVGRLCPSCGHREWSRRFTIDRIQEWQPKGSRWYAGPVMEKVKITHETCGYTWSEERVMPSTGLWAA